MSTSGKRGLAATWMVLVALGAGCASSQGTRPPPATLDSGSVAQPAGGPDGSGAVSSADGAGTPAARDTQPEPGAPGPDGGSATGGPDTAVERLGVPGAGTAVTFKTSLVQGALYLLKATGAVDVGGKTQDAEFEADGAAQADQAGGVDVGIDVGLLELHAMNHTTIVPPGPGRMKWYGGGFRADHTYYMWVTGAGKALTLKLLKSSPAAGTGSIEVGLYELGAAPPALYQYAPSPAPAAPPPPKIGREALETIQVPLTKTVVTGKLATDKGAIYLLQASGAAQVSRGEVIPPDHLHAGDAQYMDWPATGTRFNDGECGAEFGIGVDETAGPAPCTGGIVYTHRMNWWGPYRNDHIYYMLLAGTGKPISFLYYDSGYGDNTMTDTLTVKLFALP